MLRRRVPLIVLVTCLAALRSSIATALPGSLDPSFGSGGTVVTAIGAGDAAASAIAVQPDGRIVVAGFASNGTNDDFAVARYLTNGQLDASFGIGGVTLTNFGKSERADSVAIQADGKIIAAGFSGNETAVARYRTDGTLDPGFGGAGTVTVSFGGLSNAEAVTWLASGKVIVAGWAILHRQGDMTMARLNSDGTLDTSFHRTGRVILNLGSSEYASGVVVQPDGRIVLAGARGDDGTQFAVARFRSTGSLDKTFGSGGAVVTTFAFPASWANSVALQADGRISVAGWTFDGARYRIALARYLSSGAADSSFGGNGKVVTNLGRGDDAAQSILAQPDGTLLVAGNHGEDFALARYTSAGALDSTFGTGGYVITDLGSTDQVQSATLQSDGRIVVAGFSGDESRIDLALARYLA